MQFLEAAFDAVCPDAKEPESWYVCLVSRYQRYGGPEEGGWWQTMSELVRYRLYPSQEAANEAAAKIRSLAQELTEASRSEHGRLCLSQMDWLEARGLEADFLPENDGPVEYRVEVRSELPVWDNQLAHYE